MNEIFVTSDHHFGHKNILNFCSETRKFETIDDHDETLIERHNSIVKSNDEVYFLGDFAFKKSEDIVEILERLNGRKYFIWGNHDKPMNNTIVKNKFVWMKNYHELKIPFEKSPIVLFHYPIYEWNRCFRGSFHFYGHTHSTVPTVRNGRGQDIGVDSNDLFPWNVRELLEIMKKNPI